MYLLILISIIGIALVRLNFIPEHFITTIILLVICTLSINQIIMNERTISKIDDIKNNIDSAKKVDLDEFYLLLRVHVLKARKAIDLTLNQSINPQVGFKAQKEYFKEINSIIKSDKIRVRRIVTIDSKKKLSLVNEWLQKYSKIHNFHLRYSNISSEKPIPALSIQIIDSKFLFIAGLNKGKFTHSESNLNVIIESESLGNFFQEYYNEYWNSLDSIKEGKTINDKLLREIENLLELNK